MPHTQLDAGQAGPYERTRWRLMHVLTIVDFGAGICLEARARMRPQKHLEIIMCPLQARQMMPASWNRYTSLYM
jgi:hypothetical protein